MSPTINHINPDELAKNPAFSQAVSVAGGKLVFIGGQNGVLADGSLAGDDFASQTKQAYKNILVILKTLDASQENVMKLSIYAVKGQDIREGFGAAQEVWGQHPVAVTVLMVEGLARPDALVEIEAIAAVNA